MKKNNKKQLIICLLIILIAILMIVIGMVFIFGNGLNKPTKLPEAKVATKGVIDGDQTNVEKTLSAQHSYESYRIKSLRISGEEPYYYVTFIVDNISDQALDHNHLNFTFLDSNKKYISEMEIEIPALPSGGSQTVFAQGTSQKTFDKEFDYKISPAKKASLPEKE